MATSNPNVKKGVTELQMTPQEVMEFTKCATDPQYFIENYIYVRHPVKGETLFALYNYQRKLINAYHTNKEVITLFPRQSGKDLPLTTEILTPSGFVRMEDIHIGDIVYGEDGLPTNVIDESVIFNNHKMYRIHFSDGTYVDASDTHQWTVRWRTQNHKQITLTTAELQDKPWRYKNARGDWEHAFYIPNTKPVEFPSNPLPTEPYLLGCRLAGAEDNVKRIPEQYLFAAVVDRVALLQGLMDTSGNISEVGDAASLVLSDSTPDLVNDVKQLLWSLGLSIKLTVHEQINSTQLSFIVGREQFDLFRNPHKLAYQQQHTSWDINSRIITGIEYLGDDIPSKCISVDNNSHLYLATRALIPTHNSETSCAYLFWFSIFNKDKTVLITSNKHKNAREMISRIKYMYEHLPNFLKPGVTADGWNALSLMFETGSRILSDATSESTGRGGSFSILYADETAFVRPAIQEEFWASISPTLATGGKLFLTSTPNGDRDLYATLWRGAQAGTNGFVPVTIKWNEVPGRDYEFKKKEISKNGLQKWAQEFECQFISSEPLLIDSLRAQLLRNKKPLSVNHGVKIWRPFDNADISAGELEQEDKPIRGNAFDNWFQTEDTYQQSSKKNSLPARQCIMTVDPAKGIGNDFTVIEVFSYPELEQMMEWRSNVSRPGEVYKILKYLWKKADEANWDIMFTVENNGVGEGLITLFETDDRLPENVEMVNENNSAKLGLNTNMNSKAKACRIFKEFVESGKITINSLDLIKEIKTFVQSKQSYAAQPGSTDDCVMATILMCRVVELIASYDESAHEKLYEVGELNEEDEFKTSDGEDDWDEMPIIM